jgi:SAM-dependent methyltransferase
VAIVRYEIERWAMAGDVDVVELRSEVQSHYAEVADHPDGEFHFHTGRFATEQLGYDPAWLSDLPESAVEAFAGVANPFAWGLPGAGEKVVDVGSGAGFDAVVAAGAVGPRGAVVGVDMTPAMLKRATELATSLGFNHLEFREGLAEDLPVAAGWADLVISNGVLNLVPDKVGAYREVFRVLRPGGRIQIGDVCVEREVPEAAKRDIDLWTG